MRPIRVLSASLSAAFLTGSVLAAGLAPAAAAVVHHPRISAGAIHSAGWASSNWSGYARTAGAPYTKATAQWVVPSVSKTTKATYGSQWVGIDGFNNGNLIQTGTETDWYNGAAHYAAWWEILPAAETVIASITVHPGDHMSASIVKGSGSTWTISLTDTTTGATFSTSKTYTGPGTSVEWIEEAPTVGGHQAALAHYSSPDLFDPGTANNANPGLTAADSGVMVQQHKQVSTPSLPDSDTDGFNMSYGSSVPPAPGS
ncbi:MAG TPA: G1 family glutamic endopeptidase [Candidatus Limnocylindrales bacterium]